ncbi:MAG: ergothioneine biosynthesis protein EgtB [Candidatus Melainabacteria bacterium]|nr:ergothioneine biosynthesis protein EgtB [Candidatus Melainabacteria bacterium]
MKKPLQCSQEALFDKYTSIRNKTEWLCAPLQTEDFVIQTIEDVSPPKWHLGHTSWFFETFILNRFDLKYKPYNEKYSFIFNSYYETVGSRVERPKRGLLNRPTVEEIYDYRKYVDKAVLNLIENFNGHYANDFMSLIILGLNHEEQHQELILTDIKHIFASNLFKPVYLPLKTDVQISDKTKAAKFIKYQGGLINIGNEGHNFSFDNESPCHKVYINDFEVQNRLVTNGEFLDFINDSGYKDHRFWLSDGWDKICKENWTSPLYWEKYGNEWFIMTLSGLQKLVMSEPVCHVSYFEADAYAKWSGKRLPTEYEWEYVASSTNDISGNFMGNEMFHPLPSTGKSKVNQLYGDAWEWTRSAYLPYPGYKQPKGAIGEYNGKFMSNQMVLRGGSCATPKNHIRSTYRNFLQCDKRWQFSGFRLANDLQ